MTNAHLKIGDVAKQTGTSVGALRYYEMLKLLYPDERGENGYRYYSVSAVQQVQFIKKAQTLGFSLEEIRQIVAVRDRGEVPCQLVRDLLAQKIDQLETQILEMTNFKAELEGYRLLWEQSAREETDAQICPLIETVVLEDA